RARGARARLPQAPHRDAGRPARQYPARDGRHGGPGARALGKSDPRREDHAAVMSTLKRVEEALITGVRVIVGAAIFVSIAINFGNIAGRFILSEPVIWAEEILSYLMVWSVCLGAVLVTWEGRH